MGIRCWFALVHLRPRLRQRAPGRALSPTGRHSALVSRSHGRGCRILLFVIVRLNLSDLYVEL